VDVCDKWAALDPEQPALIHEHGNGHITRVPFGELRPRSNQTANCLRKRGVTTGSRVAILLAQSSQTAFAHIAAFKAGAISVPLFALFGEEALESAFDLMSRHGVTHVFLPPMALKMLRAEKAPLERCQLHLRSVASGGESLGVELLGGREALGVTMNEFYGQTECNMVVSSCSAWFAARPGAIGRPVPGHDIRIVDDQGVPVPTDAIGNIPVRSPDPVMFLGYWNNPSASVSNISRDGCDTYTSTTVIWFLEFVV
jgi:acyl-coenzyme A synthetase/AMP-(fatty) acid ligase